MKLRKIISLFSAIAVTASLFSAFATTSFAAPATDSKPEIVGEVESVDGDGYAIMKFKLVNNEVLSYNLNRGKVTSNGINAIQVKLTLDESVFDTSEAYITGGFTGVNVSGDNTANLTFVFAPTSVDSYMINVPEYIFEVDALLKDGYNKDNIPSSAVKFGATRVEYTSYAGVKVTDGATTYTVYGVNLEGAAPDYPLTVKFGKDEPKAEITGIAIDPTTVTVKGGETQEFTVEVAGTGDYDKTYALTATAGTFDGNVFTAPAATDAEQTITITATANGDSTKTATATVTVPAKEPEVFTVTKKMAADDMYVGEERNPVKVFDCAIKNVDFAAPVVLTFKAGEVSKDFDADFSAFDGDTELGFSVLMFGAPANLTLDSITQ